MVLRPVTSCTCAASVSLQLSSTPFNLQFAASGDIWLFGEDRFKWHMGVAPVFSFRLLLLFWCCCYLLVCLFLRHDLKLAVSEVMFHIELQASHLENHAHTFVNLV